MVYAGKALADVTLQHVAMLASEGLAAIQRAVSTLAQAIGIAVVDEAALEERPNDAHQRMVDHPVTEGSGGDEARLGLRDAETAVGSGTVAAIPQFGL